MIAPVKISIRTNLYLWLLTGRSNDFANGPLNTGVTFSARRTPPEVTELRGLLGLDVTDRDFFAIGALAAARMSTSILRGMPEEDDAVFARGILELPGITSTSEMLPPSGLSWPSLDGGRAGETGFGQIIFQRAGATTANIFTDSGIQDTTTYSLAHDGVGNRLALDKAAEYGVNADFRVTTWAASETIRVTLSPTRYPFAAFAAVLQTDSNAVTMMNNEGTLQAFTETSNPALKVGMAALAIIRRMIKEINDNQEGFEVSVTYDGSSAEPLQKRYEIDPSYVEGLTDRVYNPDEPVGFDA